MSDSSAAPESNALPETTPLADTASPLTAWLDAAGFSDDASPATLHIVRRIGTFLENTGQLPHELVLQILADIDFTASVTIVPLPTSTFVKSKEFNGCWLTDTGVTVDSLKSNPFPRRQKLFACPGAVPALKAVSKSVHTEYRREHLFAGVIPHAGTSSPFSPGSAGTQYLFAQHRQLREV